MDIDEVRRIARAISSIENRDANHAALLQEAYLKKASPVVIGITGPPGVGKSTLVDGLAAHWSEARKKLAILAVDPSSPYSGGAILGDRIRRRLTNSNNVFFRSLSSRGHVGGVTNTMGNLVIALRLFAFEAVIIETVGAGQADTEISEIADCSIVVTVGNLGDGVQAGKAGLMEIADIFAVNKADLPGADETARTIENTLALVYTGGVIGGGQSLATRGVNELRRRHGDASRGEAIWTPPVLRLSSARPNDVATLAAAADEFIEWYRKTGRQHRKNLERSRRQIFRALSDELLAPFRDASGPIDLWTDRVSRNEASPQDAARDIIASARHP